MYDSLVADVGGACLYEAGGKSLWWKNVAKVCDEMELLNHSSCYPKFLLIQY